MDENEARVIGYCEECGNTITGNDDEAFVDVDGNYYCCTDCVLEHYGITRLEL